MTELNETLAMSAVLKVEHETANRELQADIIRENQSALLKCCESAAVEVCGLFGFPATKVKPIAAIIYRAMRNGREL